MASEAAADARRWRRGWLVAAVAALVVAAAAVAGCSMLEPFEPSAPGPEMAAKGLSGHSVDTPSGPLYLVATPPRPDPAVVFVHGSPGTWDAFRLWLVEPKLAGRARLVSVDRPGFGRTERGRAEPSLARQAARIAGALDEVGVERAVLVGHSLGAPVIARLAVDAPELAAGLLLIAPSIDPALERRRWYNVFGAMRVVQWFLPVDWVTSNREIWPLKAELERLAPELAAVRTPVIVVQGEDDELVPPANAEFVARAFASADVELRKIPEAGHFVLWERPAIVTSAVEDLLARAAPRASAP